MENEENHLVEIGSFFGVYILKCKGPERRGDVYIGFTVNPMRRIRQHNREIKGGAWKTKKNKGNWDMVLIVHGFKSKISALQFEWAWQNPHRSKRLSHLKKKTNKEEKFAYKLRILSEMLNTGPWNRLPLTIQWLKQEYHQEFPVIRPPPIHMPIAYGQLKMAKKVIQENNDEPSQREKICLFCNNEKEIIGNFDERYLLCIVKSCDFVGHMLCFAEHFLKCESSSEKPPLLPVSGRCPGCSQDLLWGDLVRQRRYSLEEADGTEESEGGDDDDEAMSTQEEDQGDNDEDEDDEFQ